jgi:hypothetical protein
VVGRIVGIGGVGWAVVVVVVVAVVVGIVGIVGFGRTWTAEDVVGVVGIAGFEIVGREGSEVIVGIEGFGAVVAAVVEMGLAGIVVGIGPVEIGRDGCSIVEESDSVRTGHGERRHPCGERGYVVDSDRVTDFVARAE